MDAQSRQHADGQANWIAAVAQGLTQQLQQVDGRRWSVEVASEAEHARDGGTGAADSASVETEGDGKGEHGLVQVAVLFDGVIAGTCTLQCDAAAAGLIAGSTEGAAWLRALVQGSCERVATALQPVYGVVQVKCADGIAEALAEAKGEAIGWLLVTGEHGETLKLTLCGDAAMRQSLQRLEAVAAAAASSGIKTANLSLVMDVELNVSLRFGERRLSLREIMELASGSVVELDREVDEPVELILDGRVIARGEAVIVDGNYGIRVTEVLQPAVA
jgi:flagellar motor switch protein FliN